MVIGRYGEMSLAKARRRAREMLQRIRAGANPADDILREKRTPTVKEFAREYLRRCDPYWKPSGRKTVRIYLKARILPHVRRSAFGPGRPGGRVRVVRCREQGQAWRGQPCVRDPALVDVPGRGLGFSGTRRQSLRRHQEKPEAQHRPLSGPRRVGAARAGARRARRPMAGGRRRDPSVGPHRLPQGRSAEPALARHHRQPRLSWRTRKQDRVQCHSERPRWPSSRRCLVPATRMTSYSRKTPDGAVHTTSSLAGATVCADAKLGRLRLHDLRHTAASQAVMSGENLPLVGKLLGHRRHSTTAGYAHLADSHLVEAAERIGSRIAAMMKA